MKLKNIIVFSNCHGEHYINIFKRDTNILEFFTINYIVSYKNLDNFDEFKSTFEEADVLITNNIKNYHEYTINNLKSILKKNCLLIVIPFVRFDGYWVPEPVKRLEYAKDNSVSFFPNVEKDGVNNYLSSPGDHEKIIQHFNNSVEKLITIESESDIKFMKFFMENHQTYPLFRDYYHPTFNMIEYIGAEIVAIIQRFYESSEVLITHESHYEMKVAPYEYGHYKPIRDCVKEVLKLDYDLDKVFVASRHDYLYKLLQNEEDKVHIKDLYEMLKIFPLVT